MLDTPPSQQVPEAPSALSEGMHLVNFFASWWVVGQGWLVSCLNLGDLNKAWQVFPALHKVLQPEISAVTLLYRSDQLESTCRAPGSVGLRGNCSTTGTIPFIPSVAVLWWAFPPSVLLCLLGRRKQHPVDRDVGFQCGWKRCFEAPSL